jgi:hypothetical protein
MLYRIRWRQEGETIIFGKSEDDVKDKLSESLKSTEIPHFFDQQTEWDDPELLSCEVVDRGPKS